MRKFSRAIALTSSLLVPALLAPAAAQGKGAGENIHVVVLICGTIGSAGTNLLSLYVQGISSDDPIALAAVGVPTQPPPGIDCVAALAKLMSLDANQPKPDKPLASYKYTIQSVVSLEHGGTLVYTLVSN